MKWLLSSRNEAAKKFLIVGLGNPGAAYETTRHNVGFRAVRFFAKKHGVTLRKVKSPNGEIGSVVIDSCLVKMLLPLTYMNSSGEAVEEMMRKMKLPPSHLAVVVDDVALPVGSMRLKEKGSDGGHNGLKSIASHLGTIDFPRLRMGVGHPAAGGDLAQFVLSPFDHGDENKIVETFPRVADVLECWILQGARQAMTLANTKG